MSKYNVTHQCGHQETHGLFGRSRDRASKEQWLQTTLCSECYRAEIERERAEATKAAAGEAEELGLPALTGTEKQAAWAERIRAVTVATLEERLGKHPRGLFIHSSFGLQRRETPLFASLAERFGGEQEKAREFWAPLGLEGELNAAVVTALRPLVYAVVAERAAASWWIDSRENLPTALITDTVADRLLTVIIAVRDGKAPEDLEAEERRRQAEVKVAAAEQARLEAAAAAETTIRPETATTPLVVEIRINGNEVSTRFPERSEALLAVVHRFGSEWRAGEHIVTHRRAADLAVEIAHRLLAAGIPVRLQDPELRRRAAAGEYTPYTGRSIGVSKSTGHFALSWDRNREDWYEQTRRLPGSHWRREYHAMHVPPEAWAEVEDFAAAHSFEVTPAAERLITERRELAASVLPQPVGPLPASPEATAERPKLGADEPEIPTHLIEDEDAAAAAHH